MDSRLEDIMRMDTDGFFQYVKSIRYGYKDRFGTLHFADNKDFTVQEYSFSSPDEIVQNNCCLCWDLAEFIKLYCAKHDYICKSYFMEYLSEDLHQTHTQVFLYYREKWSAAPDNCLGLQLGTPGFDELAPCVEWFLGLFTDHLKSVLKGKYDEKHLLIKEYTCTFPAGISDEEFLLQIRQ